MKPSLARRTVAEFIGTAFLVAAVIGSGIMAERLSNGNLALALLANTIATGAALVALILTFGPVSGAHLNPVVTIMDAFQHGLPWSETPHYVIAQILGGITGAFSAHIMFGLSLISLSHHVRSGPTQIFGEFVATFGLLAVIWGCSRLRTRGLASSGDGAPILSLTITDSSSVAYAVGAYITAAYWFTSSTSFANPAVTIARSLSDTFAGIRLVDVPAFVFAQFLGALVATLLFHWFFAEPRATMPAQSDERTM